MPPVSPSALTQREILADVARRYGGTWEGARLTAVNLPDGESYPVGTDGTITPELARAILRVYDCE